MSLFYKFYTVAQLLHIHRKDKVGSNWSKGELSFFQKIFSVLCDSMRLCISISKSKAYRYACFRPCPWDFASLAVKHLWLRFRPAFSAPNELYKCYDTLHSLFRLTLCWDYHCNFSFLPTRKTNRRMIKKLPHDRAALTRSPDTWAKESRCGSQAHNSCSPTAACHSQAFQTLKSRRWFNNVISCEIL